jgi:hypothetical protein
MDHVERMKDGLAKIADGIAALNCGPAHFTLEVLFAAYYALVNDYARYKVGQRVALRATPTSATKPDSGWWSCRHFLVPDNPATVQRVWCDSDGRLRYDVEFDRETWINRDGQEQPVIAKHVFSMFETELTGWTDLA